VRRWLLGVLILLSSPVMAQEPVPEIPFESIPDPLKFPPDLYLGEATGVAVNSKGHVFVFSRGNWLRLCRERCAVVSVRPKTF
jgi:hypothetical protein